MLGCGNVGSQVARLLKDDQRELSTRSGAQLVLKKIAVRDTSAKRENVDASLLTTDAHSVVTDPEIDIVIEVMGGIEPARALILEASQTENLLLQPTKLSLPRTALIYMQRPIKQVSIFITKQPLLEQSQSCVRYANHS